MLNTVLFLRGTSRKAAICISLVVGKCFQVFPHWPLWTPIKFRETGVMGQLWLGLKDGIKYLDTIKKSLLCQNKTQMETLELMRKCADSTFPHPDISIKRAVYESICKQDTALKIGRVAAKGINTADFRSLPDLSLVHMAGFSVS